MLIVKKKIDSVVGGLSKKAFVVAYDYLVICDECDKNLLNKYHT